METETAATDTVDTSPAPACPPSVSAATWEAAPAERRAAYVEAAAAGLRRGVHPMDTFHAMLRGDGIEPPPEEPAPGPARPPAAAAARTPPPVPGQRPPAGASKRPPPVAGPRTAPQAVPPAPAREAPSPARPAVPFGSRPPSPGPVPVSLVGAAIHSALGLSGPPGRVAAEAEAGVLAEIAADPAMAYWNPGSVRGVGSRVSRQVAEEIAPAVAAEALRVAEHARAMAAQGDAAASRWDDPDAWQPQASP